MAQIDLSGKIAIVTGASSGLGHATAKTLAEAGATVIVNHPPNPSSKNKAASVVAEIEAAGERAVSIAADVSQEEQVDKMVAETVKRFVTIDVFVANAGIERPAAIEDNPVRVVDAFVEELDLSALGSIYCPARGTNDPSDRSRCSVGESWLFKSSSLHVTPWSKAPLVQW